MKSTRGVYLMTLAEDILDDAIEAYAGKEMEPEDWDLDALKMDMSRVFGLDAGDYLGLDFKDKSAEEIRDVLWERIVEKYEAKEKQVHLVSPDADEAYRTGLHAADCRHAVERPPLQPRPSEGRHRTARIRAEGSRWSNTSVRASSSFRT